MVLGIVGHAADKFTPLTEYQARTAIRKYVIEHGSSIERIISGGCHLGGVDKWAEKIAESYGIPTTIYTPNVRTWSSRLGGYRERNLQIASNSDKVLVVVVSYYLSDYNGMRFESDSGVPECYHCGDRNPVHVKSGGCWTAWRCKDREWIFI